MALNNKDLSILEEIITLRGDCLYSKRCLECPFRSKCLPEFLNFIPPTTTQRMNMALDVMAYHQILDDKEVMEEVKSMDGRFK